MGSLESSTSNAREVGVAGAVDPPERKGRRLLGLRDALRYGFFVGKGRAAVLIQQGDGT